MGSTVVSDTPADSQVLFLKVDVRPGQTCHFPKPETCEIGYLYRQDCIFAPLAKLCNQQEFQKSGTEGKCIEAREFIIALPESFPNLYEPDKLLQLFTDCFREKYGVSVFQHCTITNERLTTIFISFFRKENYCPNP